MKTPQDPDAIHAPRLRRVKSGLFRPVDPLLAARVAFELTDDERVSLERGLREMIRDDGAELIPRAKASL